MIRCGECGYAMHGNKRPSGKDGEYISYRCGCKKSKNLCTNGEIRKEPLEEFIMVELEKRLFNDEVIPEIVKEVNSKIQVEDERDEQRLEDLQAKLDQTNKEIDNIINAIMSGITSQFLKTKMNELEVIKVNLEAEIIKVSCNEKKQVITKITEEQVRTMISEMKGYVINRDLPQCKQLIRDFVKEVIVCRDHVEVIFNMVFSDVIGNYRLVVDTCRDKIKANAEMV